MANYGVQLTATDGSTVETGGPAEYLRSHYEIALMVAGVAAWALLGKRGIGIALLIAGGVMLYLEKVVPSSTSTFTVGLSGEVVNDGTGIY
jgi:hypothetical protein